VQPPRRRASSFNLRNTATIRSIIFNATALITTILLLRLASLTVPGTEEVMFARYVDYLTLPLAWPPRQLPVLDTLIGRDVHVADLVIIPLVFVAGLLAAGIIAGWEEASSKPYDDPSSV
jgi:hypothetical protein